MGNTTSENLHYHKGSAVACTLEHGTRRKHSRRRGAFHGNKHRKRRHGGSPKRTSLRNVVNAQPNAPAGAPGIKHIVRIASRTPSGKKNMSRSQSFSKEVHSNNSRLLKEKHDQKLASIKAKFEAKEREEREKAEAAAMKKQQEAAAARAAAQQSRSARNERPFIPSARSGPPGKLPKYVPEPMETFEEEEEGGGSRKRRRGRTSKTQRRKRGGVGVVAPP